MENNNLSPKLIMSIDPSGTGTTGITFFFESEVTFLQYKNEIWQNHLLHLFELIKSRRPQVIIYEDTNYVHKRTPGTLNLLKLIGGIASFELFFDFLEEVSKVAVNQVKSYKKKLFSGTESLQDLTYRVGRGQGWKYRGEKINLHQLDSLIIYNLWSEGSLENKERIQDKINLLLQKKRLGPKQKEELLRLQKNYSLSN